MRELLIKLEHLAGILGIGGLRLRISSSVVRGDNTASLDGLALGSHQVDDSPMVVLKVGVV